MLAQNETFLAWLERNMLSCPFKNLTSIDCPGCGFQRSVLALFKGDIWASMLIYPATIPFLGLLLFTAIHLKFDFKHGALGIKILYILVLAIVIFNYLYKVYNHQIF